MSWNCIIVEDEYPARLLVANYIENNPLLLLQKDFRNPLEALEYMNVHDIDIVFLDIQMPAMTGLEFIQKMPQSAAVILTTAYQEFALQSYDLQVVDYLLKPFTQDRFDKAVDRADKHLQAGIISDTERTIKDGHEYRTIPLKNILYVEGMREYVRYHTESGKFMELISMKALEEALPDPAFKRVHKSYIVNRSKIERYNSTELFVGPHSIPIGKTYRSAAMAWLDRR